MEEPLKRHSEPRTGHFTKEADGLLSGTVRDTHEIKFDEPEDLPAGAGDDEHPSPVDYMFASLIGCQISVLNQALHKARIEDFTIEAEAKISPDAMEADEVPDEMPPHTANRIQRIEIDLSIEVPEEFESRAQRCLDVYDQGCVVGQSFRAGIDYTTDTSLDVTEE